MTLAKGAEWCIIDFSQGKGVILTRIPILDSERDLSWKRAAQVHSITTGFLFQVKRKMKPHLFLVHLGNQTGIFNLNWRLTEISDHQTRFGDQTSHMIGRQNPSNEPGRRSLVTKIYVEMRKKKRKKSERCKYINNNNNNNNNNKSAYLWQVSGDSLFRSFDKPDKLSPSWGFIPCEQNALVRMQTMFLAPERQAAEAPKMTIGEREESYYC